MRIWRIELAARRRVVPLVGKAIVGHARLNVVGLGTRFADRTIRGDERRHGVVDAIEGCERQALLAKGRLAT
jgi:hypothetical protein